MKNLRVEFHVVIYETTGNKAPFDTVGYPLLNIIKKDTIKESDRLTSNNAELSQVILDTIKKNTLHVKKALAEMNPPISQNRNELSARILKELCELFPGIGFSGYWSDDRYRVYNLYKKDVKSYASVPVNHPKAPHQRLTEKYPEFFAKLDDGRWTYGYNSGGYFKGVAEIIPAPIDESKMKRYFKKLGVDFTLATESLDPLPEPEKECNCDHHNEYGI
jgi:hypothetical protein